MCQFLHINMSIFLHFPSINAHLCAKKAVSLHIENKKLTFINVNPIRSWEYLMNTSYIQPSKFVKHFVFNLNNSLHSFILSRFYYDISQVTNQFSTAYDDDVFDSSMTRSRFNLRYLFVVINHFQGRNLYEKVCNYFLINPLHSYPLEFLKSSTDIFNNLEDGFVLDIYYYLLYEAIYFKMVEEDLLPVNA